MNRITKKCNWFLCRVTSRYSGPDLYGRGIRFHDFSICCGWYSGWIVQRWPGRYIPCYSSKHWCRRRGSNSSWLATDWFHDQLPMGSSRWPGRLESVIRFEEALKNHIAVSFEAAICLRIRFIESSARLQYLTASFPDDFSADFLIVHSFDDLAWSVKALLESTSTAGRFFPLFAMHL